MIRITVKTVAGIRRRALDVAPDILVWDLRRLIAETTGLPGDRLSLVVGGRALPTTNSDGSPNLQPANLKDGDTLIAMAVPRAPPKEITALRTGIAGAGDHDDDEDEDMKFNPHGISPPWKRKLAIFLKDKLRLPDLLLIVIFSIKLHTWVLIIAWLCLSPVAAKWDLGPIYVLGTAFALLLTNLGRRQSGELRLLCVIWRIGISSVKISGICQDF
ncbi:hypothetical protein CBR_g57857 [Chara braunii]|uniref:Ubiquitin-like domain-containing protein n=1 Tax=Chara braunii TaxID=69332 RepID=A0A388K861_CHABU|nr:hypothetical protein CBR_g57857 [Chara braunii]|eukprot:GBG66255.1 hypothetical protein CBR_g57857 [Chara braunii]